MYEVTRVIAEFASEMEAQVAIARLRFDRICAVLTGDVPCAASFSLFGRMPYAPIQLAVAASQADRAKFILSAVGVEVLEEDWEQLAECEIEGWICALCDSETHQCLDVCCGCGTRRFNELAG
jgi:hypothetical protein